MFHMTYNSLNNFLKYTLSQKEVSLVIAKNAEELTRFQEVLENNYFKRATEIFQLIANIDEPQKIYFVITDISKDLYDFLLQYPSGQVEIFDSKKMRSTIISPIYDGVSVVFLVTKETLSQIQKGEFPVLEAVGLTYQR